MRRRYLLVLAILGAPAAALARASAGVHASGGAADSFAHELVQWLSVLAIPLAIGVVAFVVYAALRDPERSRDFVGVLADFEVEPSQPLEAITAAVRAHDPAFDDTAFQAKVKKIFLAVQEAWLVRDPDRARAFMSDGVLRRFTSQLALMAKEGVRSAAAGVTVLDVKLLNFTATPFFHVLEVYLQAQMRGRDVPVDLSDEQARTRAAHEPLTRFSEIWTFVRRPGATTRAGYETSEGHCPNCGAAFPGSPTAQCSFCKAIVNGGHYDWVLFALTQSAEARFKRRGVDCGPMLAKDPGFNPFAVEDRASVMFWRKLQAEALAARRCSAPSAPMTCANGSKVRSNGAADEACDSRITARRWARWSCWRSTWGPSSTARTWSSGGAHAWAARGSTSVRPRKRTPARTSRSSPSSAAATYKPRPIAAWPPSAAAAAVPRRPTRTR